jgi:adenosylmethionine-8-amino-7-oxononanoate transaminase
MRDRKQGLIEQAQRLIWHPFTQMSEWESEVPTLIVRGSGATLTDLHGKRYLDGTSSLWVNLHGHRKAEIDRALVRQIGEIAHSTLLGLSHPPAIALAERLLRIAPPGLVKVFYSDNGSTAVEVAIKMAFGFWRHRGKPKKQKFFCFTSAYHGDTLGAMSVGGIDLFHEAYQPLTFKTIRLPTPTCYRCPWSRTYPSCGMVCVDAVEEVMKRHHAEAAALVIEPMIQAAAGMVTSPPGYLAKIRALCNRYEVLMIADEVATGFGRTGKMFACEHEEVSPDLLACAKGLTGGYLPLAATLTTQTIYDAFLGKYEEFKTFFHGHSYTGNPLGCAAGIANLKIFENEKVLKKLQPKIRALHTLLRSLRRWKQVGDVRQIGLMVGIELVADKETKRAYPLEMRVGGRVCREAARRGLLLRPLGNVVVLMPPLSISMRQIGRLFSVVKESIKTVTAQIRRAGV